MSEFSRTVDLRHLPQEPVTVEANEAERAALAARFGIVAVESLRARLELAPRGQALQIAGQLSARIVQACAVSGEDLKVKIEEPIALRFVPPSGTPVADAEIELTAEDLDEIELQGSTADLGEAVAQTLSLAIDPYLTGPGAAAARKRHGLDGPDPANPFSVLKGLKAD